MGAGNALDFACSCCRVASKAPTLPSSGVSLAASQGWGCDGQTMSVQTGLTASIATPASHLDAWQTADDASATSQYSTYFM